MLGKTKYIIKIKKTKQVHGIHLYITFSKAYSKKNFASVVQYFTYSNSFFFLVHKPIIFQIFILIIIALIKEPTLLPSKEENLLLHCRIKKDYE